MAGTMSRSNPIADNLFNENPRKCGSSDTSQSDSTILEQYKLYVEMADRISSRRLTANSFFLSVNTAIVGALGYINTVHGQQTAMKGYWFVAVAGIVLSYMWYRIILSYRDLNNAKFKVIYEIEQALPLRAYDAEWEALDRGRNPKLYRPFTRIEVGIPWVFLSLHVLVLVWTVPWSNLIRSVWGI